MLNDFFKLNEPYETVKDDKEFIRLLQISKDLRNILFEPDKLEPTSNHPKLKIRDTNFNNVSFSKTQLIKVVFINCSFEDCLFIGTEIINCEFHNCKFKNTNTHKIKIRQTYINPQSFVNCFNSIHKANIGIHLFQQLITNSENEGQIEFRRTALFHFRKWQDKLTLNKFLNKEPYKISLLKFLSEYPISWLYRQTFGYGLRLRNFLITFLSVFVVFYIVNQNNWNDYLLKKKDLSINAFHNDSVNVASNIYYTLDATTKLVDSQFQATSDMGMFWLIIQSIVGFVFFSALITIILNRFVK